MEYEDEFKDFVLNNIDTRLKNKLLKIYKNGLTLNYLDKNYLKKSLYDKIKEWFKENGVLIYV